MVSFVSLDVSDEQSIDYVLSTVDQSMQYGEDVEPKEPPEHDDEENQEAEDPLAP